MSTHPELSEEDYPRLRSAVSNKGMEINTKLTKLLAGQDTTLADLSGLEIPSESEDKIAILKAYLAQISLVLQSLGRGDYGKCAVSGRWIPRAVLLETPWSRFHPDVPDEQRRG